MTRLGFALAIAFCAAAALAQQCPPIVISSVTPASGPVSGGTTVTITGEGFYGCAPFEPPGPIVTFGGVQATGGTYDGTHVVVKTPFHVPGPVDIRLVAWGTEGTAAQAFTFVDSPAIPTIRPSVLLLLALSLAALAWVRLR